ncbi:hypothetical protein [Pseudonocardia alaniniphila]|nr:hypothetical protein [Pseudonocardia alaniniphila]
MDPFYLIVIVSGLLASGNTGLSVAWLVIVAIAWPALAHRNRLAV